MTRQHPEQDLQILLVDLLRGNERKGIPPSLPRPWRVFSTKNHGEQKTQRMHGIHKAMGLMKGMVDLTIIGPEPGGSGWPLVCTIELKAPAKILPSGNRSKAKLRTSPEQDEVMADFRLCGVRTLVSNDVDTILDWLRAQGVPLRVRTRL